MRRLIWALVCRRCDRLKIPHWSRYWVFWLMLHLLLFFDCLNGDGYGKSRLVGSTVGSRLYDNWVRWGKKLCMCVCFLRKYADTKLLHFHNWMNHDPKLTVHCQSWILIDGWRFRALPEALHVRIQRGDRGSGPPWNITSYMGLYRE